MHIWYLFLIIASLGFSIINLSLNNFDKILCANLLIRPHNIVYWTPHKNILQGRQSAQGSWSLQLTMNPLLSYTIYIYKPLNPDIYFHSKLTRIRSSISPSQWRTQFNSSSNTRHHFQSQSCSWISKCISLISSHILLSSASV